jgi:hypothetical protein
MQNNGAEEEAVERFILQCGEAERVWGLQDSDGSWAICESQKESSLDVLLVWSDQKLARERAVAEWAGFKPVSIDLQEFVDQWLRGMHYEGGLVGPNWDAELSGAEIKPAELAKRFVE